MIQLAPPRSQGGQGPVRALSAPDDQDPPLPRLLWDTAWLVVLIPLYLLMIGAVR